VAQLKKWNLVRFNLTMKKKKQTRVVKIGNLKIGGGNPIAVQSMCDTDTRDVEKTVKQVKELEAAGCEIVRLAVVDKAAALALGKIKKQTSIPLVADIHFDYQLAVMAVEAGVDKIRINPGNIGSERKVREVVRVCQDKKIPIRVGVNIGSLDKKIEAKYGRTAKAMVASAWREINILEKLNFHDIVISLKASDVPRTILAYRLISEKVDYPLHLGVTEAGTLKAGIIKSSIGLGILLNQGIGDTIRVSLTAAPLEEIRAAWQILKALKLRSRGPTLISCPTCGRTEIDLIGLAGKIEEFLEQIKKPITVAVMGCAVNGPGEAKEADIGLAGGKGKAVIFKKGAVLRTVPLNQMFEEFTKEIKKM